uniref:NaTx n=1 Tax=Centruroides hentzi TaxID=88313 RepID=A0A2I9LPB5_9SCOR
MILFVILPWASLSELKERRSGFLLDRNHCKIQCSLQGTNSMCEARCASLGATNGYCKYHACFCTNLKKEVKIWGDDVRCRNYIN